MTDTLHLDFETRSELDLREVGLHNYARHPSTDVWCAALALGDAEPVIWTPGRPCPDTLQKHVAHGGRVVAHNAPFELAIWNAIMAPRYGWPELKPEQTFCTMAQCYAMGLPGALEDAALTLGLPLQKDTEGRALMLRMARPRSRPGATPVVWWNEAEKLARLYEYCRQDVRVERLLEQRLMPLSDTERRVWLLDYRINQRGVFVDRVSVAAAATLAETLKEQCNAELGRLTDGAATTVSALIPLKAWLAEQGVRADSLAKQDLAELLNDPALPALARRALELRQEAGKASTAKFNKMLAVMGDDHRLRNLYQYHGAGTGRWAGRGVQVHNLVRDMPPPAEVEAVLTMVRAGDSAAISAFYDAPLTEISRCMRSFFTAPAGRMLIGGDWSSIEGRGQAWFAGEEWKLQAFRAADEKRGPGMYELAYSRMFNVPVESIANPSEERQIGKVAELAFGYQGGVGSWATMSRTYRMPPTPESQVVKYRDAWRAAHPKIKAMWKEIENAAINAVITPEQMFSCGFPGRQAHFKKAGSFLWLKLPSGRVICYPYPKLLDGVYGPMLTYMTVPSPEDRKSGKVITDKMNSGNWVRISTYGGSLFNNIVQGFSSDILRDLMLRLDECKAEIVLHTHDDCNIEIPKERAERAREMMQEMMRAPPAWAAGFPLFAKCVVMKRYGKG